MTRPTPRIVWRPDPVTPYTVWAMWWGAGDDYWVRWDDGSDDQKVSVFQGLARHTYPARDAEYLLRMWRDGNPDIRIETRIAVRGDDPPFTTAVTGRTVTVELVAAAHRRHRVWWDRPAGVHTILDPGVTSAEHTYPAGVVEATVVVDDLLAQRSRTAIVDLTDRTPGSARMRWVTTDLDNRVGELRLVGFPPTTTVTVWWLAEPRPVVTDGAGAGLLPDLTWPKYPADRWWSPKAGWVQDGRDRVLFVPVHPETMAGGTLVAAYTIDPDDPASITVLAYTGVEERTYVLYWGDDTRDQLTAAPDGWVEARHRYPRHGDWQVRLEGLGAGGRTSDRLVQPATPAAITDGPDYVDYDYRDVDPCDRAAVLRAVVDGPNGRDVVQTHRFGCRDAGVRWGMPDPGDYTITFYSAMQDPIVRRHTTKTRGATPRGPQPKGQKHMSGPPALVAEGYVYAKTTVGLRITNLFAWADKASLSSPAFGDSKPFELEIKTEEGRRYARASIPIAEADAGEYAATLHLPHGITQQLRVIVEDRGDGTFEAAWAKVPDGTGNLHYLRAAGLSRNASHAEAKTALAVGNDWFGMIKEPYGTNAKGTAVAAADLKPGATYPVEVKLKFPGGFEDIVKGAVTLPLPEPKPVLPGFKVRHEVDLAAMGDADTITHKISFGSLKQTNTEYVVAWTRKCHDPQGKPVKPTREEAAELAWLEPYHYVRHLDHVEFHTVNPHQLRGNTRFKPIYIVTIAPVEDDDGFSGGDRGDEGEHDSAGAGG